MIGYFANKESENYKTFTKLASMLRDSCHFVAAIGYITLKIRFFLFIAKLH